MPRVKAANEAMAKYLKHPITKIGFSGDMGMTVNWPDDSFTNRRIRDGDVTLVEDEQAAKAEKSAQAKTDKAAEDKPVKGAAQ
jgi:hypothetical protein